MGISKFGSGRSRGGGGLLKVSPGSRRFGATIVGSSMSGTLSMVVSWRGSEELNDPGMLVLGRIAIGDRSGGNSIIGWGSPGRLLADAARYSASRRSG
jgi:hypothetical protein